jgi:hypothetical protein
MLNLQPPRHTSTLPTPALRLTSIRDVQSLSTTVRWIGLDCTVECRYPHETESSGVDLSHVGLNPEAQCDRNQMMAEVESIVSWDFM